MRFRQHINNLAPDGSRFSVRIDGSSRDSTTTGSFSFDGQTDALTTDTVSSSTLTTDTKLYVQLTR